LISLMEPSFDHFFASITTSAKFSCLTRSTKRNSLTLCDQLLSPGPILLRGLYEGRRVVEQVLAEISSEESVYVNDPNCPCIERFACFPPAPRDMQKWLQRKCFRYKMHWLFQV